MNCKQLNSIGLEEVLRALGHLPIRQNEKEAWYPNPFGPESHASFKVDRKQNLWYLFSEGVGGNTTDFLQKYFNCPVTDVLKWVSDHSFFSFHPQKKIEAVKLPPSYKIDKICEVKHPNLKAYLSQRGLSEAVYTFVKEVHFSFGSKKLYAIGFENRSGGWEVRNKYYKGVLASHDLSLFSIGGMHIDRNSTSPTEPKVMVFEGFIDALSFIELQKSFQGDLLVLNSTAMIKRAIDVLTPYSEINLFLDNDKSGRNCTNTILKSFPHAKDFSNLYSNHKDLNQYLMEKRQRQVLCAPKTEVIAKQKNDGAEKQKPSKEEKNRPTKGLHRRM